MNIRFHPAATKPKTAVILTFALGILIQALWQWLTPVSAIVIWAVLVINLRDFFVPTTYLFQDAGLTVSGPLKPTKTYPWRRFRAFVKDRNGLFLSPYSQKRATEGYRGIFLPMLPEQRKQAEEFCHGLGLESRQK